MFIARVAYNLFSWLVPPSSCFHGVCRLKVSGFSSFRRFQTGFYNVLCPHFLFSSRVSLLGFLSPYNAYPFQVGLFMVFSAPNLVFAVCVTFSLVFGIFCSYCPRRDFAQKAKSRGGSLVTRTYIKESTYSRNTQSYSQYRKKSRFA